MKCVYRPPVCCNDRESHRHGLHVRKTPTFTTMSHIRVTHKICVYTSLIVSVFSEHVRNPTHAAGAGVCLFGMDEEKEKARRGGRGLLGRKDESIHGAEKPRHIPIDKKRHIQVRCIAKIVLTFAITPVSIFFYLGYTSHTNLN